MTEAATFSDDARKGILFVIVGMLAISLNDMMIKSLSGDYPLHQMVFFRSLIGISFSLVLVQIEGGWGILKTRRPGLHFLRAMLVAVSNFTFFAALAVLPLADATALFFVAPLMITLLSVIFLGERVGVRRIGAVVVGFIGVLVMMVRDTSVPGSGPGTLILILPVLSAATYAGMQILTRKLGAQSKASALALYIQANFILVSLLFWFFAGDGRYAAGQDNEVITFLFRAWVWPTNADWPWFVLLGVNAAVVGYCLSQAYRSANAATIAPFEYVALPASIFWGWTVFGDFPDFRILLGIVLIAGSGIYVFIREGRKSPGKPVARPTRRT